MNRPCVRLSSVIIMLAVVLTSGYRLLHSERQRKVERDAARTYNYRAWTLTVGLADLRAAQQAYVANGQDPNEWYARVTSQLDSLKTGLADLRAMSQGSETVEALEAADGLVERLRQVDESARDHTTIGQVLMASDLVFTDGQELTRQTEEQLDLARSIESQARIQLLNERRAAEITTVAAAAIVAIAVTFVLLPTPGRRFEPPVLASTNYSPDDPGASAIVEVPIVTAGRNRARLDPVNPASVAALVDLELHQDPPLPRRESTTSADQADTATPRTDRPPQPAFPTSRSRRGCAPTSDRCLESDQLEDVLGRACDLLNASGLIVWVRDGSGSALRPATGHGYTPADLVTAGTCGMRRGRRYGDGLPNGPAPGRVGQEGWTRCRGRAAHIVSGQSRMLRRRSVRRGPARVGSK